MRRQKRASAASELGFTLIELLIAVAIVAILAGVAIASYIKHIKTARIVEGKTFIQLIQARQETYFQQHGNYCDASYSGKHPVLTGTEPEAKKWGPGSNSTWHDLNVAPEGGYTYFQWTVVASDPGASPPHALDSFASQVGIPAQPASPGVPHPWYYVLGEADFDGLSSPYTELRASSTRTQIITLNQYK